jgi:hypothetical protein
VTDHLLALHLKKGLSGLEGQHEEGLGTGVEKWAAAVEGPRGEAPPLLLLLLLLLPPKGAMGNHHQQQQHLVVGIVTRGLPVLSGHRRPQHRQHRLWLRGGGCGCGGGGES